MKGIFLQILFAFKRDAIFFGTTVTIMCCACFSVFLGSNAVVEAQEARIVYTAGLTRIAVILGFTTFVVFYIKRMFENHEIEVILSHAISRPQMLLSFFSGFSVIFPILITPIGIILLLLKSNILNVLIWCLSVYLEGLLMLSFILCCSLIIKSFVHSLTSCFIMYLLCRIIGNFVAYLNLAKSLEFNAILGSLLKILSILIPRLDIYGKTSWLIYSDFTLQNITLCIMQTIIFCGIFLCIAAIDLRKKEF